MIKGKFLASKIESQSQDLKNRASSLSSFFQHKLTEQTPYTLSDRKINVSKGKIKKEPTDNQKVEPEATPEEKPEIVPEEKKDSPEENS